MQANQVPPDPRIQVAQMNAEARAQELQAKIKADADHASADYAYQQWEKNMEIQMEQEKLEADKAQAFDDHKLEMAALAMKLRTQAALSDKSIAHDRDKTIGQHAMDMHNNQVIQPAVEPAGRATNGNSFAA